MAELPLHPTEPHHAGCAVPPQGPTPHGTPPSQRLRCPHCHNPIQLADERDARVAMHASAQACDRRLDVEQRRRRALSQRDDDPGLDQRDLAVEIGTAGFRLERRRRG